MEKLKVNHEEWIKKGLESIEKDLRLGDSFEVKGLFKDVEWKQLSKGESISFGRYFSMMVKEGKIPNVIKIEREKNNHNKYKKVV